MSSLKKKILKGGFWSAGGQGLVLLLSLVTNIVLARILSPTEFGQLGVIMFFIAVSNVLVEGGMSGALIRKAYPSKLDYSTIFIFNLFISICCVFLIVLFSGSIARYYNDISLAKALRVSSLILIINAFQIIQNTKLIIEMDYRKISILSIISTLLSSFIAIFTASKGFGIWALVLMQLSRSFFYAVLLWTTEKVYIKFYFSLDSFRGLWRFGVNTTLTSVINMAFDNIYQLVIGKVLSVDSVGYYFQAKKLQDSSNSLFTSLNQGVLFSGLSKLQENYSEFKTGYYKTYNLLVVILGFVSLACFIFSSEIVTILFGKQWIHSSLYLEILSLIGFFYVLENYTRIIYKVYNRTDLLLKLELGKKVIQAISICIGLVQKSVEWLLYGYLLVVAIGYVINVIYSKRKITQDYNIEEFRIVSRMGLIFILCIWLFGWLRDLCFSTSLDFMYCSALLVIVYWLLLELLNVFHISTYVHRK